MPIKVFEFCGKLRQKHTSSHKPLCFPRWYWPLVILIILLSALYGRTLKSGLQGPTRLFERAPQELEAKGFWSTVCCNKSILKSLKGAIDIFWVLHDTNRTSS